MCNIISIFPIIIALNCIVSRNLIVFGFYLLLDINSFDSLCVWHLCICVLF